MFIVQIEIKNSEKTKKHNKQMKLASIGAHLLGFHKNNFEYMLCRRIGLAQRNIDGFVQTRWQLVY